MTTIIIGAGPAGLAVAAELRKRGERSIVLECADHVGSSWRGHYDRLHLHTVRWLSHLPGYRIPRSEGPWVARDGVIRYLDQYARHHAIDVRTGVQVQRIDRDQTTPDAWTVHTSNGPFTASAVVVATGYNHSRSLPEWAADYTGVIQHAADYRNGSAHTGQHVLVVGSGNTGAEIAVDLAEHGAAQIELAIRTPPHIIRRSVFGMPTQLAGLAIKNLPLHLGDHLGRIVTRPTESALTRAGMPAPVAGMFSAAAGGRVPIIDVGLIEAILSSRVRPVAHVVRASGASVELADGTHLEPHAIVLATGYRRGLAPMVGHLGVLDADGVPRVRGAVTSPSGPGLYFIGFTPPISGMLREIALDARRIGREIARVRRAARGGRLSRGDQPSRSEA